MEDTAITERAAEPVETSKPAKKQRIEIIDAARGLAITLMVIHHLFWDLYYYFDAPWWIYSNPVFNVLQTFFVSLFIFVSGISSRFSKDNIGRGAIVFVIGVAISYVTVRIINTPIYFGILNVLGTFMMFYGISRKLWDKIPGKTAIILYISLIVLSALARTYLSPTSSIPAVRDLLSVLGWRQFDYISYDYQTILPGIFIFLLGTRIGEYIKDGKFPKWFYEAKFPFFPFVGRHALVIYVLHQPVLYAIVMALLYLQGS